MVEVQRHGFTFENWVCDTLFDGHRGRYGDEWDVPVEANRSERVPAAWRNMPVSIKAAKFGSPIGLGDVRRQRQIDVPFLMIVGFWRQRTSTEKWIEEIGVAAFPSAAWAALWGELSLTQLQALDVVVKDLSQHYREARRHARAWKKATVQLATAVLVINPKIDSKSQRRIQCSLPFRSFWQAVGRSPIASDAPALFGVSFPNPIRSSVRAFGG